MSEREELERALILAENSESTQAVLLAAEVRRLRAGIQAVRDECGKIHAKWAEAKKDPSLSWYEDDPALERLSERDDVQEDIIDALNTALTYKAKEDGGW